MSDRLPLGIPPYEITAYLRIKDIVKAMDRYIEADLMNNNLFLNWAKEIICQIELDNLYNTNKEFKEYVDKYSKCHRMMIGDTLKIKVVQNYAEWLRGGKR